MNGAKPIRRRFLVGRYWDVGSEPDESDEGGAKGIFPSLPRKAGARKDNWGDDWPAIGGTFCSADRNNHRILRKMSRLGAGKKSIRALG